MKKGIIVLLIIVIITIAPLILLINKYQKDRNDVKTFNLQFEQYKEQNTYGTNIGSLINYTINNNEKHNIQKNEEGIYIDDDKYCVRVEVKMLSSENEHIMITYAMETINSLGVERFVRNFNLLEFRCTDITYNSYGKVNKIVFELNE